MKAREVVGSSLGEGVMFGVSEAEARLRDRERLRAVVRSAGRREALGRIHAGVK